MGMKKFFISLIFIFALCLNAFAADYEFKGSIDAQDDVSHLLNFYVKKFTPEELLLTVSDQPDATGKINELYMDLKGVMIDKVRLDKLTFRMYGVQFNEPSNWESGNVECKEAMRIQALGTILERDINQSLRDKTIGRKKNKKGDYWKDVSLKITPKNLQGKGYYHTNALVLPLDILIEITSGLKIVKAKELWLDKPEVKINRLDLPDYITNKALSQIQPLLNLNKFPLPLSLHKINLENGKATLSTRQLPKSFTGTTYHYKAR